MIGRGKWSESGVPHKGWTCDDVEDLGSVQEICEMCDSQDIRYVHFMSHPDYPETLRCGCVCAGHMEENPVAAERRDKAMRSAAGRRKRFPKLVAWKTSQKGNPTIVHEGYRATIFEKQSVFKFVIHKRNEEAKFGRTTYGTLNEAKLAAFDAILWLKEL